MSQVIVNTPETKLSAIIDKATCNRSGLIDARARILVLLESLRGVHPKAGGTDDGKTVTPDGSLNQLHDVLSETETSTIALHNQLDELFSLLNR